MSYDFKASGDLKADIIRLIEWRGDYLSFVEVCRYLPDASGNMHLSLGNENLWIWGDVSDRFIDAINSLFVEGAIEFQPCAVVSYLADGGGLKLPIATSNRNYKKPHWFPVLICKSLQKKAA